MRYPIRTIVAGIVSPHEDPVLIPVVELAQRCNAFLHLVHAAELPDLRWSGGAAPARLPPVSQTLFHLTRSDRIDYHVVTGPPGIAILDAAGELGADLIVVGASRRGRVAGALFGTTARHVVRHARAPVLVLGGSVPEQVSRVLLTTDLSPMSAAVHEVGLDVVETLFPAPDLAIRDLQVVWDDPSLIPPLRGERFEEEVAEQFDQYLADRRSRTRIVERAVRFGDPVAEIAAEVEEWGADLTIVGTHGRTGAARVLLGNTAEGVLGRVRSSILVVPRAVVERMELPVPATSGAVAAEP